MIATDIAATMKTASFFTYAGAGRISIARYPPRGTPPGFSVYRPLAPGPWFNTTDRIEYERRYAMQLALLDPSRVWDELHVLAGDHEPTLLCWERPPFSDDNWCHRRLTAAWFEIALGHQVNERE